MIQYRTKDRALRMTLEELDRRIEEIKESLKYTPSSFTPLPHASSHHVDGSDPLNFSSILGFSDYLDQAVKTNSSPTFIRLILTQATGTAPLEINSQTLVTNLNADLLDGSHASAFALANHIHAFYQARAYRSTNQATTNNTWVQVQLNAESYDSGNCFDSSINYCYNVPYSGYYFVVAQVTFGNIQAGRYIISVNDGSDRSMSERQLQTVSNYETLSIHDILYFNANAQVKLYAYQSTGGNTPVIYGGITRTFLAITPLP